MCRETHGATIGWLLMTLITSSMSATSTGLERTARSLLHLNDPSGIYPGFIQHPVDQHHSMPLVVRDSTEVYQHQSTEDDVIGEGGVHTTYDVITQLMDTQEGLVRTSDTIAAAMQNLTGSMVDLSTSVQNSMAIIAESMQKMGGAITNLTAKMVYVEQAMEARFTYQEMRRNDLQNETLIKEKCPGVWELVGGSCLRIISRPNKTWDDARSYCQHLGGDLASPRQMQGLRQRLKGEIEDFIWLGAHDRITDGDWRWLISGKTVEEDNWAPGEPNRGNTHNCGCLARRDGYKFHDCLCDYRMGFICQLVQSEAWDNIYHN